VTRPFKFALTVLLALSPLAAHAQTHPLSGKWTIEYVGGMQLENGEMTPILAKALFTVAEVGDSLIATLRMEPNPDLPPRPEARFAALRVAGSEATFKQRSEARMNMNGEERTVSAISTWTLRADGAELSGTLAREIEGVDMPLPPPQPVTGRRAP
jgi:hypothetical protein